MEPVKPGDIPLHSTVVLLKGSIIREYNKSIRFTFYCSSIKGNIILRRLKNDYIFTFYCSSIKGERNSYDNKQCVEPLHSTVVLLKDNTKIQNR